MNELLVVTPNGYKTSKLYSVVPADGTGDLTWVRNTTATRVNSSGLIESVGANVPRLDYTGGVTCPCILVEPQRTNLLTYSETFSNASWFKGGATITSGATTSPSGLVDASKLIQTAALTDHYIRKAVTNLTGIHRASIYAKAGELNFLAVREDSTTGNRVCFNLSNGTIGSSFGSANAVITSVGNGWYRCSFQASLTAQTFGLQIIASSINSVVPGAWVQLGDGVSGIYIWGAQLELGSAVSSYIPTTSSTQTRNADAATVTTPVGITSLIETYEDNTTNVVNPIPVTYQMSEGRIAKVVGL